MIGLLVLLVLAATVVVITVVVAIRDGYRPVAPDMARTGLIRPEPVAQVPVSRLG